MFRRDFLKTGSLLGFGASVPAFLSRTALASGNLHNAKKDTILVVVQLTGGNDGLNTVIPLKDNLYKKYRPTIAIPEKQVLKLNEDVGLHPAMTGFSKLLEDKAISIIQSVGYPNPSQSHFRSMDIWQAGRLEETLVEGWLGQALKNMQSPAFHITGENESAPLALAGAPVRVPSLTSLEDFQVRSSAANKKEEKEQQQLREKAAQMPGNSNDLLQFVQRTTLNTYAASDRLKEIGNNYDAKVPYPDTTLGQKLKLCAQLIHANLGARILYVSIDGFDTHANQGGASGSHANLLGQVSNGISAFYKDLAARGLGERVCILTFSEFGRRAKENGSKGTDHGSGAPMFLVGGKVKAGVLGQAPDLEKLEDGNLAHRLDFRQVYASVLEDWLGVDAKPILGKDLTPFRCFQS